MNIASNMHLTASAQFVSVVKTMINNKHFLLHSPLYDVLRGDLFYQLSDAPGLDIASFSNLDDDTLCHRLLLGDPSLGTIENRVILEATISFIKNSGRFD